MSFTVRKLNASPVVLDDLGLTITGPVGTTFDLRPEDPQDLATSADLLNAVSVGLTLEVLDPRDDTTVLSVADATIVVTNANDSHFGVSGGRFGAADDPTASVPDEYILQYDLATNQYNAHPVSEVVNSDTDTIGNIVGGMGQDGVDTTFVYNPNNNWLVVDQDETRYTGADGNGDFVGGDGAGGTAYVPGNTITLSDGSVITVDAVDGNGDVTDFTVTTSGQTNVAAGVALTQTSTTGTGTGFTLTPENPNISAGTIQWDVDDVFLRNTGDTLDSGTLTIASGATLNVATGGSLTIQDAPSNPTDATNKAYVDSLSAGLDPKESVRYATASDPGGTYSASGGAGGTGEFTAIDLTATGPFDGLTAGAIAVGDRLLIKDSVPAQQNGIYVVTTAGAAGVIERAPDQDGSPSNEVSGGNFTFVENGTTLASTGWVLQGDGELALNVDPLNWVQFSESTDIQTGIGLATGGNVFDLDVDNLTAVTSGIDVTNDTIAFHDADGSAESSGSQTRKITFQNLVDDLDIVNGITTDGIIIRNGDNTYSTISIAVDGLGNLDGLAVANADGTTGNPTLGLDIQNLPIQTAIDTTDRIAVYDITADANVYYTVGDVAGALANVNSFETWLGAGNTSGDASIVADSATDTATLTGGRGINLDFTALTDTVTFEFTRAGLSDTAVTLADTFPFFDATGATANQAEFRSFQDALSDLNVPFGIAGLGIVRKTGEAPDTYETLAIVESANEDLLGIEITNGGTSDTGNVEVGLDILNLTNPNEELAATDEFAIHNKSEGTAGANRKITGQEVADGVATILNITGIAIATINGQPVVVYEDSTRSKTLSTDTAQFNFGENALTHLDWIRIGGANDAESGHIMPLDGTIVMVTAHCENTGANNKDLHVFIDNVDQGSIGTLSGGANAEVNNTTVDLDFTAGQKIRIQAQGAGTGAIQDTVANVFVRWRS